MFGCKMVMEWKDYKPLHLHGCISAYLYDQLAIKCKMLAIYYSLSCLCSRLALFYTIMLYLTGNMESI